MRYHLTLHHNGKNTTVKAKHWQGCGAREILTLLVDVEITVAGRIMPPPKMAVA